tara:strand:+ start:1676 stop:2176 length:501 start_codon:yes stop_codon:yes gene_type:complete
MAKALLISRADVVKFTSMNGNIDTDKFIQYISHAQDIHIQAMTGTDLLVKIQNDIIAGSLADPYLTLLTSYIKPVLIHYAMVEYLPFAAYTISNKGIYKHSSENSENASKDEVDFLMEKERKTAQYYKQRFIDYICQNNALFPEYNSNSGSDVFPSTDNNFSGWVL